MSAGVGWLPSSCLIGLFVTHDKTIDKPPENRENGNVRTHPIVCPAGNAVALLFSLLASAAMAQALPEFRTGASSASQFPPTSAPLSDQSQSIDQYQRLNSSQPSGSAQSPVSTFVVPPPSVPSQAPVQIPVQSAGLGSTTAPRPLRQRVLEIPVGFERHPIRNLSAGGESAPFTFRTSSATDVQAQMSLALQTNFAHDDNLSASPRVVRIEDTVAQYIPSVRLNIGTIPGPRDALSLDSEYYLQLQYLPTIYERFDVGTSRTLQRIIGEAGRANALLTTALRVEYDENLGITSDTTSPEETFTVLEISPIVTYALSAKTSLRAQAFYRRITLKNSDSDRKESVIDAGIDFETSAKTSIGIGSQLGRIAFDDNIFSPQDYQQAYLAWAWKPTAKVTFQTRTGVELREYASGPKPDHLSFITTSVLNWRPDERTGVNFGVRVQNQPSISQNGTLYQEVRVAADFRHEVFWNLYLRAELSSSHRNYDSGLTQMDIVLRPSVGYHTEVSRLFDSLNIEVYYQYQQSYSNQLNSNFDRNVFGIQSTIYF